MSLLDKQHTSEEIQNIVSSMSRPAMRKLVAEINTAAFEAENYIKEMETLHNDGNKPELDDVIKRLRAKINELQEIASGFDMTSLND